MQRIISDWVLSPKVDFPKWWRPELGDTCLLSVRIWLCVRVSVRVNVRICVRACVWVGFWVGIIDSVWIHIQSEGKDYVDIFQKGARPRVGRLCYRGVPNMSASNQSNWDRYEWDAKSTLETDMIETLKPEFGAIWVRHQANIWHWYDWDALTQACTNMTETPQIFIIVIFKCVGVLRV